MLLFAHFVLIHVKSPMRVPKRLHAEMAKSAKAQGVSLNQYVLYPLTERHAQGKQAA